MSARGMTMQVLATGLANALQQDRGEAPHRHHRFGPHVTTWLSEVAGEFLGAVEAQEPAEPLTGWKTNNATDTAAVHVTWMIQRVDTLDRVIPVITLEGTRGMCMPSPLASISQLLLHGFDTKTKRLIETFGPFTPDTLVAFTDAQGIDLSKEG